MNNKEYCCEELEDSVLYDDRFYKDDNKIFIYAAIDDWTIEMKYCVFCGKKLNSSDS